MAVQNGSWHVITGREFSHARRQTLLQRFGGMFGHGCNDLLPTRDVTNHLDLKTARDLGIQSVSLDKILGSSGRYRDFDLDFRPLRDGLGERWMKIAQLSGAISSLPPVKLYKIGEVYFVEDGNHRISVARSRDQQSIKAQVIELDPSPLTPSQDCKRLGYKV